MQSRGRRSLESILPTLVVAFLLWTTATTTAKSTNEGELSRSGQLSHRKRPSLLQPSSTKHKRQHEPLLDSHAHGHGPEAEELLRHANANSHRRFPISPSISRNAVTLYETFENPGNGHFRWGFESSDGIKVDQLGFLKDPDPINPEGTQVIRGSYSYVSPEGIPITVNYIADENGFQPVVERADRIGIPRPGSQIGLGLSPLSGPLLGNRNRFPGDPLDSLASATANKAATVGLPGSGSGSGSGSVSGSSSSSTLELEEIQRIRETPLADLQLNRVADRSQLIHPAAELDSKLAPRKLQGQGQRQELSLSEQEQENIQLELEYLAQQERNRERDLDLEHERFIRLRNIEVAQEKQRQLQQRLHFVRQNQNHNQNQNDLAYLPKVGNLPPQQNANLKLHGHRLPFIVNPHQVKSEAREFEHQKQQQEEREREASLRFRVEHGLHVAHPNPSAPFSPKYILQ